MSDDRRIRTWVERLSIVAIVGCSAALAVPKYASLQRERVAAQMLADLGVLRTAVYAFYSDSAYFPEPAPGARAPEALIAYLPPSFSFTRPYGEIEYRNWAIRGDTARRAGSADSTTSADSAATADSAAIAPGPGSVTTPTGATSAAAGMPAANVIGATVTVHDERIGAMASARAQPRDARFVVGNKYTFLFFGT